MLHNKFKLAMVATSSPRHAHTLYEENIWSENNATICLLLIKLVLFNDATFLRLIEVEEQYIK